MVTLQVCMSNVRNDHGGDVYKMYAIITTCKLCWLYLVYVKCMWWSLYVKCIQCWGVFVRAWLPFVFLIMHVHGKLYMLARFLSTIPTSKICHRYNVVCTIIYAVIFGCHKYTIIPVCHVHAMVWRNCTTNTIITNITTVSCTPSHEYHL